MSHRGGGGYARARGGNLPVATPLPPQADVGAATGDVTQPGGDFLLIRAIAQSTSSPHLPVVHRLLKNVVAAASGVVRGTDSQRKFTSLYTEFCVSALRCLADVEDAVYELTHPGCRAATAPDADVDGITEANFLKEVAAYVATHTSVLGVAYLEHVGRAALEKMQKQQRKRERASGGASGGDGGGSRPAKASRTTGLRSAGSASAASAAAAASASGIGTSSPFDSLGLVDAQETMRHALQAIEREKQGAAAGNRRPAPALVTAALTTSHADGRPSGIFLSKAAAASGSAAVGALVDGTVAYDLHNPNLKLSSIPELATRLQPWTMTMPVGAVHVDRVTVERDRKGTTTTTAAAAALPGPGGADATPKAALEVCLAPTPMEFLRQWESREAAIAAEQQQQQPQPSTSPVVSSAAGPPHAEGPYTVVPYNGSAGRGGGGAVSTGGSPRSTSTTATPPLSASSAPAGHPHTTLLPEADSGRNGADPDVAGAPASAFFPAARGRRTVTSVPTHVMVNLSHHGASRMEFVYAMGSVGK